MFEHRKIKNVIITGGSSGVGFAIAERMARENINIALVSKNPIKLKLAAQKIRKVSQKKIAYYVCDIRNFLETKNTLESIQKDFKKIECLINSAGISIHGEFDKISEADYDEVMDTNLKGVFNCCKAVWTYMKNINNGQIVTISSASGLAGYPTGSIYCSSKSGVNGLMEALASEGREIGIRVFNICPGQINTPIWNRNDPEIKKAMKNMMDANTIADLVWYLINRPQKEFYSNVVVKPFMVQPDLRGRNRGPGGKFIV